VARPAQAVALLFSLLAFLLERAFLNSGWHDQAGNGIVAIDPLIGGAVTLATAATDAAYVMFTSAVAARGCVPAKTWSGGGTRRRRTP
jgi:hypothetical protein